MAGHDEMPIEEEEHHNTNTTVSFVCEYKRTERWVYRGEGNAHLVLSLPETRQILRIKKRDTANTNTAAALQILWQKIYNTGIPDVLFYKNIITPFFGRFVDDVKLAAMSLQEIEKLEERLYHVRPAHRRHKSLKSDNVAVFNDYAFLKQSVCNIEGSHYAIEIKPKQGLPVRNVCQFCLKQKIKLVQGNIDEITRYCPMDLFSGNSHQMERAIRGLIDNPQNNFQIFKDGNLIYGENYKKSSFIEFLKEIFQISDNTTLLNKFINFLSQLLTKPFPEKIDHECKFAQPLNDLAGECVLAKILSLQSCDNISCVYGSNSEHGEYAYVEKYLADVALDTNRCPRCVMQRYCVQKEEILNRNIHKNRKCDLMGDESNNIDFFADELTREQFLKLSDKEKYPFYVSHYVAKVAKDCSFMVTFKIIEEITPDVPIEHIFETDGIFFVFDIKVFDLYPKPHKSK